MNHCGERAMSVGRACAHGRVIISLDRAHGVFCLLVFIFWEQNSNSLWRESGWIAQEDLGDVPGHRTAGPAEGSQL
jgi:hypothetical protein